MVCINVIQVLIMDKKKLKYGLNAGCWFDGKKEFKF